MMVRMFSQLLSVPRIEGGFFTGCSYHMCPNRDWFATYRSFDGGKVLMRNDVTCKMVGIGSIQIRMHDGIVRTLTDVRHVPELRKNLISLGALDSNRCSYRATGGVMRIMKGALVVMKGLKQNSLYLLQGSTVTGTTTIASPSDINSNTTKLWHMCLRHMSERGMDVLSKQGLLGSKKIGKLDFCEHYIFGKQCRVKFSRVVHTTKGTMDYIHSNLWGSSTVPSKGGGRYMLTFIDDFLKKVWVYILKKKSDVFVQWKQFKMMIEKQIDKEIKCLRTDNGMKFCVDDFTEFCKNEGIVRHRTVRKTPQQNGVVEHMNMTLLERARMYAFKCRVIEGILAKAVNTAAYLVNRSPSTTIDCKTPEEVWSSKHTNYENLRTFGCPAYAHKKELIDAGKDQGIGEKVELEVRAPDSLHIIPIDKEYGSHPTEENEEPQEQQYNIARTDREEKFDLLKIKHTSIRLLLAMVALYDLELEQLDVKTAFLHGELKEHIFTRQAEGFVIQGKEDHVCLLQKSLYGLKQSPRQWYKRFDTFMIKRDYAGDLDRRRSLTGYIFTFLCRVIIWKATLQTIVMLSTTEAEYIAATEAVKEAIWLKGLVGDLGLKQESSTVYCDSQSAIHLTKN
ncbi:hypothetical protein RJ639_020920 [Escallonia herrerae]|uniref:Integrase catalytic domain-containing protein n=1 Tax=Escallonia herrerae TaxID=1293975 RepID=A0AA88V4N6_9ASTE|nr:hypothetical protein RJ639_020920 [Escallonia herrerae]